MIILDIKPKGKGTGVEITYLNPETNEVFVKKDHSEHITTTQPIPEELAEEVLEELKGKHPDRKYELKNYGFTDKKVIWQVGSREDRKDISYKLEDGEIFITEPEDKYLAKPINERLAEKDAENNPEITELTGKKRVRTTKAGLSTLNPENYKIIRMESPPLEKEEALELKKIIRNYQGLKEKIESLDHFETPEEKYKVKFRINQDSELIEKLKKFNLDIKRKPSGKPDYEASIDTSDPLNLNSPTKILRFKHPLYSNYSPDLSLEEQVNKEDYRRVEDLERTVEDVFDYYLQNTAAVDLEVVDWNEEEKISGRVYAAILKSEKENKLYLTKEAWKTPEIRSQLKTKEAELVFAEDELDLVKKIDESAKNYKYITGHNFDEFDQKHLTKKYLKNSWSITTNRVLDTLPYLKNRVKIFKNNRLESMSEFEKSQSYEEQAKRVKSTNPSDVNKDIKYTETDGEQQWELIQKIMKNAVAEAVITRKPLQSVFRAKPELNFLEAEERKYFLNMNSHRDKHVKNPNQQREKIKGKYSTKELLKELINDSESYEQIEGYLGRNPLFFTSFFNVINETPEFKYLNKLHTFEKDALLRDDLSTKILTGLSEAIEDVKEYAESTSNKFGSDINSEKLYKLKTDEEKEELNLKNRIFTVKHNAKSRKTEDYDDTIAYFNSLLKPGEEDLEGYRAGEYRITEHKDDYTLGRVRAITLGEGRFVGVMNKNVVTQGVKWPRDNPKKAPPHEVYANKILTNWVLEEPLPPLKEAMQGLNTKPGKTPKYNQLGEDLLNTLYKAIRKKTPKKESTQINMGF